MAIIIGNANNEVLPGTVDDDVFQFFQGGNDTLTGAGGNDEFVAGGAFTAQDRVDGGAGFDTLRLNGNYGGGITFANTTMTNVEMIRFDPGSNYSITTHDANVAAGTTLIIEGRYMNAGSQITFNGANENTGYFSFYGGDANENYTGGVREDYFGAAGLGNDTLNGGGGNDAFSFDQNLNAGDHVDGGAGQDQITLSGDYNALTVFADTTIQNIEFVYFGSNTVFRIVGADGSIAAGAQMFLDGRSIGAGGRLIWNGSAETDGRFVFYDSMQNDGLYGGAQADEFRIFGGAGDYVNGGDGNDTILMGDLLDVTDIIYGAGGDDFVSITGDYSAGLIFTEFTMSSIETLQTYAGNYKLNFHDGTVAAGETMTVSAGSGANEWVVFNGAKEMDGHFKLYDGAGDDTLTGGQQSDYISGQGGGDDKLYGAGGDDYFAFFGQWTTTDFVNGGTGNDTAGITSDTSGGVSISAAQFVSVENFTFYGDHNHKVTAADSLVAGGVTARVDGYFLTAAFGLDFNGAAETNGAYDLLGGLGNDRLASGAGNDRLNGGAGGTDTLVGGAGNDTYAFMAGDTVTELAGGGTDTIEYDANITLGNFANFENATLTGLANINVSGTAGSNVLRGNGGNNILNGNGGADTLEGGSGSDIYYVDSASDVTIEENYADIDLVSASISRTLSVNIENLNLSGTGNIDGNGNASANVINGNTGNNILRGYDNGDTLNGKEGQDILLGGAGRDTLNPGIDAVRDIIRFSAVTDSTGPARDLVSGIDLTAEDVFDFTVVPVSIAAAVNAGTLNEASFDADLTAAIGAAQLGVGQAVLFDASAGDLNIAGHRYLVVDANGEAGYQSGEDYVVQLVNATGSLTLDDFS